MSRTAPLPRAAGPFFVLSGVLHFLKPRVYDAMMPDGLPKPRALVYASGVAEVAGGAGLMARDPRIPGGRRTLLARLPFQLVFAAWVLAAGRPDGR